MTGEGLTKHHSELAWASCSACDGKSWSCRNRWKWEGKEKGAICHTGQGRNMGGQRLILLAQFITPNQAVR